MRLISAPLVSANSAIAANSLVETASGPWSTTSSSGPSEPTRSAGRDRHRGDHRHEHVDDAGDAEPEEQRAREDARRVACVSSATLTESSKPISAKNASEAPPRIAIGTASPGLELERAARVAAAVEQEREPDHHDEQQPAQLDRRQPEVDADRLLDAAEVDERDDRHEHEPDEHGREVDELAQVVAAEGGRERRGGGDAGGHHRERDDEGEEVRLEGPVHVERRARRLRVLRDELGVGGRREEREHAREQERGPDRAADLAADLADERVDAGAEHVADHEHGQHRAA